MRRNMSDFFISVTEGNSSSIPFIYFLSVFRFQLLQKGFTQHGLGKFASHLFEYLS